MTPTGTTEEPEALLLSHWPAATPYRAPPAELPPPAPFEKTELGALALLPHRLVDLVLVERGRFASTIAGARHLPRVALLLAAASVFLTFPYAFAIAGPRGIFHVGLLLLGSAVVCFPSLHVFGAYLGSRATLAQNAVVALLIGAVAATFTLGFAPIVWFVRATSAEGSGGWKAVSAVLLTVSVLAGAVHLFRVVFADPALRPANGHRFLLAGWQLLFLYVAQRLGAHLGLL